MPAIRIRKVIGACVAGFAFLAAPMVSGAFAQEAPKQDAWVKICNKDPKTQKELCLVTQELRTATGQFLASVAIREIKGEARKTMVIAVPPGMLIQPGLRTAVDAGKKQEAKYGICFPNACYAEMVIDDTFVASMKKGGNLILTALNQQAKAVPFKLTLTGFTKVYDGEPLDAAELQQKQQQLQEELKKRAEAARQKLIDEQKKASEAASQ